MSSKFNKVAAVAASTLLVVSGATAANAAEAPGTQGAGSMGQINAGSLGGNAGAGSSDDANGNAGDGNGNAGNNNAGPAGSLGNLGANLGTDSLKAYGTDPDSGSLLKPVNFHETGSFHTPETSLGEPTLGSLAGLGTQVSGSFNVSSPAKGTGSIDTTGSVIGEPTSGSLAPVVSQLAAVLGTGEGITTVIDGSSAGAGAAGSLAAVVPLVIVGGSVAAGIAAAPMIQQALAGINIQIPGLPPLPGMPPMPQPPMPQPPAPQVDNGRG